MMMPILPSQCPEMCDWTDNDCNGILDDNPINGIQWFMDADSDGFGVPSSVYACTQPIGYANNTDDCDDTRFESSPVALNFAMVWTITRWYS